MRFGLLAKKCYWGLWGFLVLALLGTLVLPDTREAHFCALRAFFHLSRGQTKVSPGGHTSLTESYCTQRKATAAGTPDNYLAFGVPSPGQVGPFPPPNTWAADPLLPWATIQSAGRVVCAHRTATTRPASWPCPDEGECIRTTLELVRLAKQVEPENGVIWLAEAVADFARGEDGAGLAALDAAVQKKWTTHEKEASSRRQRLLMAAGVPAFDAAMPIWMISSPMLSARSYAAEQLAKLVADSVRQGNDVEFVHRLDLLRNLQGAGQERPWTSMVGLVHHCPELADNVAASQGITLPPRDSRTTAAFEARSKAEEDAWKAYLRLHAPGLAETIISEEPMREAEHERLSQVNHARDMRHLELSLKAEAIQKLEMLLIGALLAALIAGILAKLWPPEWPDGKKLRLRRGFLLGLIPAFALMFLCIWPAVQHLGESENISSDGAWDPASHPLLSSEQKEMLYSAAVAVLPILVLISGPAGRSVYRAGVLFGAWCYLAGIIASAILRHEAATVLGTFATW